MPYLRGDLFIMEAKDIVCLNCGGVNDYRTEMKSGQLTAWCNGCDKYIKNISYQVQKFYFGKHKGKAVKEVEDKNYLQWFLDNAGIKKSEAMLSALKDRISEIDFITK